MCLVFYSKCRVPWIIFRTVKNGYVSLSHVNDVRVLTSLNRTLFLIALRVRACGITKQPSRIHLFHFQMGKKIKFSSLHTFFVNSNRSFSILSSIPTPMKLYSNCNCRLNNIFKFNRLRLCVSIYTYVRDQYICIDKKKSEENKRSHILIVYYECTLENPPYR